MSENSMKENKQKDQENEAKYNKQFNQFLKHYEALEAFEISYIEKNN